MKIFLGFGRSTFESSRTKVGTRSGSTCGRQKVGVSTNSKGRIFSYSVYF